MKSQTLDLAVLSEMQEPLTIQIDRVKNGQRSPIPLPLSASGSPPGVGWSKEEIQAIEQGWLVNDWAGGGLYIAKVTDSNNPPTVLEWRMYWSPSDFPEKIPPTLTASASPRLQVVPPPTPSNQQANTMQFPGGLPSGGILPQQPQQQQPQYVYYQQPQQPQYGYQQQPQVNPQQQAMIEKLQSELMQTRLDSQARDHAAQLERERAANSAAIARLEAQIRELATATTAKPAVDPAVAEMREQMRQTEARLEAERREREAERREQLMREQMREMAANTQRQIEAITSQMNAQIQALTAASSNKGLDPMITMMMEQNRNFVSALGELSRNQGTQLDKFGTFMLNPRDIIAMQKDASGSLDQLSNKLSSVYSNVMDMQQRVIENAMQLNQGGSETVGLIRDGITNAKEMFERYVGGKARAETAAQQASAQAAVAQAQAQAINAQAAVEMERLRTTPAPTQPVHAPRTVQQPAPSGGISGPPVQPTNQFEEWQRSRQAQPTNTNEATKSPSGQRVEPVGGTRTIHGRTDEQWFTAEFTEELKILRQGVDVFLAGLAQGKPGEGATVEAVVDGILQAQAQASMMGRNVPAISELLNQGDYVKFVEVLVPDAPELYKADVVKMLSERSGDDDDGDDEDGEEDDDVKDGSK